MKSFMRYIKPTVAALVIIIVFFIMPLYLPSKPNTSIAGVLKDLYPAITALGGLLFAIPIRLFWLSYMKPILELENRGELANFHPLGGTLEYICNRVIVRNIGRSAATNCKGYIVVDNRKERVCWTVPQERPNATINAQDNERLDLCAFLYSNGNHNKGLNVPPSIIAPTEDGWENYRDLTGLTECEVLVTAENAELIIAKIRFDQIQREIVIS
jgi:hypothetical protein